MVPLSLFYLHFFRTAISLDMQETLCVSEPKRSSVPLLLLPLPLHLVNILWSYNKIVTFCHLVFCVNQEWQTERQQRYAFVQMTLDDRPWLKCMCVLPAWKGQIGWRLHKKTQNRNTESAFKHSISADIELNCTICLAKKKDKLTYLK